MSRYLLHQSRWIPTALIDRKRWYSILEIHLGNQSWFSWARESIFQGFTNWLYGNGLENSSWMALGSMLQIWTQTRYESPRMRKDTTVGPDKPASLWINRMGLIKFLHLWGKNAHKCQHSYQRANQEGMPSIVCVVRKRVFQLLLSAGSWALGDGATGVKAEDKPRPLLSTTSPG